LKQAKAAKKTAAQILEEPAEVDRHR
jgi:hypothetical protein